MVLGEPRANDDVGRGRAPAGRPPDDWILLTDVDEDLQPPQS